MVVEYIDNQAEGPLFGVVRESLRGGQKSGRKKVQRRIRAIKIQEVK